MNKAIQDLEEATDKKIQAIANSDESVRCKMRLLEAVKDFFELDERKLTVPVIEKITGSKAYDYKTYQAQG